MSVKLKPGDIETRIFGGHGQPLAANGLENDALCKTVACVSDGWSILRKLPPRPERDSNMTDLRCSVRIYKLMCSKKKLKEETMVQCLERIILEARDVR